MVGKGRKEKRAMRVHLKGIIVGAKLRNCYIQKTAFYHCAVLSSSSFGPNVLLFQASKWSFAAINFLDFFKGECRIS